MDSKQAKYHQVIQNAYPELRIVDVFLNSSEGQYNDILLVNNEIIFRFPKFPDGIETLRFEVQLLTKLQGKISLAIPNPVFASIETDAIGEAFMGYFMISGEPLWRERFQAITDEITLDRMASQLAGFLRELHSIAPEELEIGFPVEDGLQYWTDLYAEFQQHLFPFMRSDARTSVDKHFENFLENPDLHQYEAALRHGDFGTGNILYDQHKRTITGIIDFGFAGIGDPAEDIAAVMTSGRAFFHRYFDYYPEIQSMLERANFYVGTYALQEALYGVKHNNDEAFRNGIAAYTLKRFCKGAV